MSATEVEEISDARREELAEALTLVRRKIQLACVNRPPDRSPPCLVAVSKNKPASDIRACHDLGQIDFGENYLNELVVKASTLPESIRWHFIGTLQSNKCKAIAAIPNLYCLHTLDSAKKADTLQKALHLARKEPLKVMIQINTSEEESKSGLQPIPPQGSETSEVVTLTRHIIKACPMLELHGLMTIGSLGASMSEAGNPDFQRLINTRDALCGILNQDCDLGDAWSSTKTLALSMGMSADFEEAIRAGSDVIRVGTGIFGSRFAKA